MVFLDSEGQSRRSWPASEGVDAFEVQEAPDIIDEVGKSDLHFRSFDTDGADEQPSAAIPTMLRIAGTLGCSAHAGFLIGEHMLDTGVDHGLPALERLVRVGMSQWGGFWWWTFDTNP